ncbi:MAG: twitch domain-containing radical SAM protein [Chitinophagales bacterium]|nr:twitch domain-containing radical SAM protein [Chitinophagales bacterium]
MANIKNILSKFFPSKKYDLRYSSKEFTQELLEEYNLSRPKGPQNKLCFAPFKSIYFGHYGKAHVCCYNRDYVIGTYPKQSIKEIWQSKEANNLRTWISNNNLDYGCQLCKNHILAKNFAANKAKQYDELKLNSNGYPSVIEFELSNTCNLECTMCSGTFSSKIRQNREGLAPLPQVYDSEFVEQLTEFIPHLEEVKFYGGEPFLIELYFEIWEKIIALKPSIRISVQTNATILNTRVKKILEQSNFHINISIDSLIPEKYEKIRVHAKYNQVIENIHWFRNYCKERNTFFGISACLMQENWDEAADFVEFCKGLDSQLYFHFLTWPEQKALASLPNMEIEKIYQKLSAQVFEDGTIIHQKNIRHFKDTIKQIQFTAKGEQSQKLSFNDIESIKKALIAHIEKSIEYGDKDKKRKKDELIQKLDALVDLFGAQKVEDGISHLNFNEPLELNQFIEFFENKSIQELINLSTDKNTKEQ